MRVRVGGVTVNPSETVRVYVSGTTTPIKIYLNEAGTVEANGVLTSGTDGSFEFWADVTAPATGLPLFPRIVANLKVPVSEPVKSDIDMLKEVVLSLVESTGIEVSADIASKVFVVQGKQLSSSVVALKK